MFGAMKRITQAAILLLICSCSPPPKSPLPWASAQSTICHGSLKRLQEHELVKLLVGARMRYADEDGICPAALRISSGWEQEFRKDGALLVRADRANSIGRYTISGDTLCTTASSTVCQHFYRDELGGIYEEGSVDGRPVAVKVSILR